MRWADAAEQFVQALASPEPTPGGGAAAATAGAMGCALVLMAIEVTLKRKNTPADIVPALENTKQLLSNLQTAFHALARRDAAAYAAYVHACKLPKEDPSRLRALQDTLWTAAFIPADTAQAGSQALTLLDAVQDKIAPVILSDVFCARHLLRSAIACCVENIRANLKYIKEPEQIGKLKKILEAYEPNGK